MSRWVNIEDYFEYLTGLKPTKDQTELLKTLTDMNNKKIIISAGRQSGKTLTCAVAVLWYVFEYEKPIKVLLISAQENILYFHIREIFKRHPEFTDEIVAQGVYSLVPLRGFESKKGSIVYVKGATDKQIRGLPADVVFIDEACECKDDVILTALGNLSGPISKFILLSTPHKDNLFTRWATDENSGFKVHMWSAESLPWHDKTILETKKKEMSSEKYAVEVLGRPPTIQERGFFSRTHINKCVTESPIVREGGTIEIGIDFGEIESSTILTVIERVGRIKSKILNIKKWKLPPELVSDEILVEIRKWNPTIVKADNKPPEYMNILKTKTRKIVFIDCTFHKELMLGQLQKLIREHNILIPQHEVELIKQLTTYKRGMKVGDDYVDSLALAIYDYEYKPSYGRIYLGKNKL
jgi:hypothetical protein